MSVQRPSQRAYNAALTRLRMANEEEFARLYNEEREAWGLSPIKYVPNPKKGG